MGNTKEGNNPENQPGMTNGADHDRPAAADQKQDANREHRPPATEPKNQDQQQDLLSSPPTDNPTHEQSGQEGTGTVERPMDTRSTEGVTRLEQLMRGNVPDQRPPTANQQSLSRIDQTSRHRTGPGVSDELAKEWMDRAEADPGQVLRRQFEVEERRELEQNSGRLVETRPW